MNQISHFTDRAGDILRENGISPSYPRLRIFRYMLAHRDHPSVDTIYRKLVKDIPTLSRTTVYNTLNLLVERGLAVALASSDQQIRYDVAVEPHAHFHCDQCGHIYDIPEIKPPELMRLISEHQVADSQVRFSGICKNCKK